MRKVSGSAILESTIAVVIIAVCVAMSYTYISTLLRNDQSSIRTKANLKIEELLVDLELRDKVHQYSGFTIYQRAERYSLSDDLVLITFEVADEDQNIIMETKHIRENK